jgi:hypothetical protein
VLLSFDRYSIIYIDYELLTTYFRDLIKIILKLTPEIIEPETLRETHFQVPSQYHQTNPSELVYRHYYRKKLKK